LRLESRRVRVKCGARVGGHDKIITVRVKTKIEAIVDVVMTIFEKDFE